MTMGGDPCFKPPRPGRVYYRNFAGKPSYLVRVGKRHGLPKLAELPARVAQYLYTYTL